MELGLDLSPVDPREILLPAVRCLSNFTGEGIVEPWGGPPRAQWERRLTFTSLVCFS